MVDQHRVGQINRLALVLLVSASSLHLSRVSKDVNGYPADIER